MKTKWITVTTVVVTLLMVAGLATAGWWFVGRNLWGGTVQAQGPGSNGPGNMMLGSGSYSLVFYQRPWRLQDSR